MLIQLLIMWAVLWFYTGIVCGLSAKMFLPNNITWRRFWFGVMRGPLAMNPWYWIGGLDKTKKPD